MPALLRFPSFSSAGFRVPLRILATAALIAGALIAGPAVGQPSPVPRGDDRFGLIEPWGLWEDTGSITTKWKFDPFGPSVRYGTGDLTGSDTYIWIWEIIKDDPWPTTFGWSFGVSRYPPVSTSENNLGAKPKEYGYQGKSGDVFHQGSSTPWGPEIEDSGDKIMFELNLAENELTYYTKKDGEADFKLAGSGPAFNNLTDYSDDDEHVWRAAASIRAIRPSSLEVVYANARPRGFETPDLSAEGDLLNFNQGDLVLDDRGPLFDYLDAILIDTLPTSGELFLDENSNGVVDAGEAVEEGDVIGSGDLDGTLTWAPPEGSSGTVTASFNAWPRDEREYSNDSKTISMSLTLPGPTNTAPTFTDGANTSLTVVEDVSAQSLSSRLAVDDSDSGQTLEWTVLSAPSNGTLSGFPSTESSGTGVQPSGVTYEPDADVSGSDAFDIQVDDGNGGSDVISVNVTVQDAPVVSLINRSSPGSPTNQSSVTYTVNFSEDVFGVSTDDFAVTQVNGDVTGSVSTVSSSSGSSIDVTVNSITGDGDLRLDLNDDDSIIAGDNGVVLGGDGTSGPGDGSFSSGEVYTIDNTDPGFGTAASSSIDENTTGTVIDVNAGDDGPPGTEVSQYSLSSNAGSDADPFSINSTTGELTLDNAQDFEGPTDDDRGSDYELTVTATDDVGNTATQDVTVTIDDVNEAPTLDVNNAVAVDEGSGANQISGSDLAASDPEQGAGSVTYNVTSAASNGTLYIDGRGGGTDDGTVDGESAVGTGTFTQADVDSGNLLYSHDGSEMSSDSFGFDLEDGQGGQASGTFSITVNAVNDAPTVTGPGGTLQPDEDVAFDLSGANEIQISDVDADGATVEVALSANDGTLTLGSTTGLAFDSGSNGAGAFTVSGTVTDLNNALATLDYQGDTDYFGADEISAIVNDRGNTGTDPGNTGDGSSEADVTIVSLDVQAVPDAPSITAISDQSTDEDTQLGGISFTVDDAETTPGSLTLSFRAGTPSLIESHTFGGSGANRTLQITPAENQTGSTVVTVEVSDGGLTAEEDFQLTIDPVNDLPTVTPAISTLDDTVTEDAAVPSINLTVDDVESGGAGVTVTASSDNQTLVPDANLTVLDGGGGDRTLDVTPATDENGTANITVTLDDGTDTVSDSFTLTVNAENDAPAVSLDQNSATIPENNGGSVTVAQITINDDGEAGSTNTVSLSGADAGDFAINGSDLAFTGTADFETKVTYDVTVEVDDADVGGSPDDTAGFTLSVSDVDETPAFTATGPFSVSEAAGNGSAVGDVDAVDGDGGASDANLSYAIVGGNTGSAFAIDGGTGEISVADASTVDYEASPIFTLDVEADDGSNAPTETVTVNVNNAAPATPIDGDGASGGAVAEDAANGTVVGITADADDPGGGTVTYTLADDAGGRFQINAGTGVVTVADRSRLDFESTTSHTIDVQASDDEGATSGTASFTISVTDVDESPVFTANGPFGVSEATGNGSAVGDVDATDGDAGAADAGVTYGITGGNGGGAFAIDNSGAITVADASLVDHESSGSFTLSVEADDGGSTTSSSVTVNVSDAAPSAPTDSNGANNEVAEDAADGTAAGVTASSSDPAGGAVSYVLTDDAGGRFQIDGAGAITVADASLVDFESAPSHTVTVRADDPDGTQSNPKTFTIDVGDVAPVQPTDADGAANEVAEDAANGTATGVTASSTDPSGGTVSYVLTNDAGGRFQVDASTGQVTVADGSLLDFESATSHTVTVRADDDDGTQSSAAAFTIDVTDVDEPPTIVTNQTLSVNEGASATLTQTFLETTDLDQGAGSLTYMIDADVTEGELFNANTSTQLDQGDTFTQADVNGGDIEYQHGGTEPASESFDFTVSDGAGESVSGTFSITINQVNDAPTLSVNTRNPTFTEDGSAAGVFSGASVDAIESGQQIQTLRLTVTNLADGSDEILVADGTDVTLTDGSSVTTTSNGLSASVSVSAGTGTVTLRGSVSASTAETIINGLAYKNASEDPRAADDRTVTLTQIVDDGSTSRSGANSGSFSESSAVDLQAVNDAPVTNNDTDDTDEDNSVSAAAPGVLGNDSDVDDSSGALSVASVEGSSGNVGAQFTTSKGALFTLNDDGSYTYDPNGQFEDLALGETAQDQITYTTQDDDNAASGQATLTVTVNGADDVPVFTAAGPFSVGEAASNGTSVGDVGANDGDGGATDANVTYAITAGNTDVKSNADVPFAIDSNSGAITVNDASDLDFENPTSRFALTVQADDGTNTSTATVTVNVTDVAPSQPTDADGTNNEVSETASDGTAVGVTASSADPAGGTVSYLLTDDAGGRFQIDGSSGEVTLADRSLLDFESARSHTVTVRADDSDGTQSVTQDISISVTDAPVALANQTVGPVSEDAANGAAVGSVATTGDASSSFSINGGNPDGAFAIDNSGQITVATASAINFETKSSYALTVSASDGTTSDDGTVTVSVTDVNDPPAVTLSVTAPTLDENNTPPSSVATISIDDDALGTNTLSLSGADAGSFQISGTNLQFTSAANFEAQTSYDVTVEVNDPDVGGTPDDNEALTLSIDDVNEAPQITNSPAGSVDEDASYGFTPTVTDPDQGDTETFSIVNQPSWASFNSATGDLSGTPANADVGSYTDIEITVADRDGATDTTGPFTIDVNPVNDAPTISSLANQTIDEDDQTGALSTTLDDDDDPAGSLTLSARSSNQTLLPDSNLALGGSGTDRTVTAIPTANASGTATVTVTVSDGEASASTAFVLTVEPVNDPPVADDDSYGIPEDQRLEIVTERAAVLANDSDIEGDPLSATVASGPSSGSLSLNADGTFTYEPNADFDGTDTFTYTAHDGNGGSDQAMVSINVQAVNDAPTIAALADQTIDEDSSLTDVSVTIGDAETTADALTVTAASDDHDLLPPDNLSLDGSGTDRTLTAAPAADSSGSVSIAVSVSDGDKTNVQSFDLTVDPVNDPPVAVQEIPDVVLAVDGPPLEMTGLAESVFEDVENDPIALSGVSLTSPGVVSSEIAGSVVTLTPRAVGSAEAVLVATDGTDEGSAVPFEVTVEPADDTGGQQADESATGLVSTRRRTSTTVDFGSTGTDLEIREMGASVAGVIRMHFYLASEDDGRGAAAATSKASRGAASTETGAETTFDNLSTYRWEAEGTVPFESANLRFDLSDEDVTGITDPSSVTVVQDTAGTGEFEAVTTIYDDGDTPRDPSDDALVAEGITSLGTFRLASNDPANLLPVELAGFAVELDGEAALLQWQTASETNNAGFYVERSATGAAAPERWSQLGFVEGNGSTEEAQRYRFTDRNLPFSADSLAYRLRQVDTDGTEHLSGVVTIDRRTVEEVALQGSFPNPARSQATIRYALPEAGNVELIVFDLLGRRVASLVDQRQRAGRKTIRLDAGRLPSGTYVYRLTAGGTTKTRKFVVVH